MKQKPKTMSLVTNEKLKGHVGKAPSIQGRYWENNSLSAMLCSHGEHQWSALDQEQV